MSIYDYSFRTIGGKDVSFSSLAGKVLIVVNTASKCGFTEQYKGLEALYKKYRARGLEIVGFPSNDFAGQEPGANAEIQTFCTLTYGVSFVMAEKTPVRGEAAHPVFSYLASKLPFKGFDPAHPIAAILEKTLRESFPEFLEGDGVKWNFTKFLIDSKGRAVSRFEPTSDPSRMEAEIERLLPEA